MGLIEDLGLQPFAGNSNKLQGYTSLYDPRNPNKETLIGTNSSVGTPSYYLNNKTGELFKYTLNPNANSLQEQLKSIGQTISNPVIVSSPSISTSMQDKTTTTLASFLPSVSTKTGKIEAAAIFVGVLGLIIVIAGSKKKR